MSTANSTLKPLPEWRGDLMEVPVPNFLMDAWDSTESFAIAFCDTYESVTQGYDKARERGVVIDAHVDEDAPSADLHSALLRGEGWLGSVELARRYGCARQHVWRVAQELGATLERGKSPARQRAEQFFADGVTSPAAIIAAWPDGEPPRRNTISQWRTRWERGVV